MRISLCTAVLAASLPAGFLAADAPAPVPPAQTAAVKDMSVAALDFWNCLDASQREKAGFTMEDAERENWHFIPKERKGITFADLRPDQDHLVYGLLSSALSSEGMRKVTTIMSLEHVLWELENHSPKRNPEDYHVSIFGTPGGDKPWAWRFEGHHMSFNFTVAPGGAVSVTPSFLGANPGEVKTGDRAGLEVLGDEDSLGRALAKTLTDAQKAAAILPGEAPADVITAAERRVSPLSPGGLPSSQMDEKQRALLWHVIHEYVNRFRPDLVASLEAKLKAGSADTLTFGWIGGLEPGEGHYYRVQSPDFLFEFDNTQNGAHHPHAVWRDFAGDFGADLLRAHYDAEHPVK